METQLIPIGNSKGIRIPSAILKQCGLNGALLLEVRGKQLVISKAKVLPKNRKRPRAGWADAIQAVGAAPLEWADGIDLLGETDDAAW